MTIQSELFSIVAEETGAAPGSLTARTTFADLGLDSLDFISIVLKVGDRFNLEIPPDDPQKWETLGDMEAYLDKRGVVC